MVARWPRKPAELVAVQVGDVGLVIDPWSADVHRRGVFDDAFFFGVAVEPDDRAQPTSHRRPRLSEILELAGEAFDVDAANLEQAVLTLPAPRRELAQIQRVGVTGVAAVTGEEPEQSCLLGFTHHRLIPLNSGTGSGGGGHDQGPPCSRGRRPDHNAASAPAGEAPEPTTTHLHPSTTHRCRSVRPRRMGWRRYGMALCAVEPSV